MVPVQCELTPSIIMDDPLASRSWAILTLPSPALSSYKQSSISLHDLHKLIKSTSTNKSATTKQVKKIPIYLTILMIVSYDIRTPETQHVQVKISTTSSQPSNHKYHNLYDEPASQTLLLSSPIQSNIISPAPATSLASLGPKQHLSPHARPITLLGLSKNALSANDISHSISISSLINHTSEHID